jgi:hypothetical protein
MREDRQILQIFPNAVTLDEKKYKDQKISVLHVTID